MISHVVSESNMVALTNVSRKVQPKILLESTYLLNYDFDYKNRQRSTLFFREKGLGYSLKRRGNGANNVVPFSLTMHC